MFLNLGCKNRNIKTGISLSITVTSLNNDLFSYLSHTFSCFSNYTNLLLSLFSKRTKKILIFLTKEKLSNYRKIAFICKSLINMVPLFFIKEQRKISGIFEKSY